MHHTCATRADGSVWCWGLNNAGQLGDGSLHNRSVPVRAGALSGIVELAIGGFETHGPISHSCARASSGRLWCWGANAFGQLGDGTTTSRSTPVPVLGIADARALGVAATHTCAVRADGHVWCWGANDTGQLGTGNLLPPQSTKPTISLLSCRSWKQGR